MPTKKVKVSAHIEPELFELLERSVELQQVSMSTYVGGLIAKDLSSDTSTEPEPAEPTPKRVLPQPAPAERKPDAVAQTVRAVARLERPLGDFSKAHYARRGDKR